MCTLIVLSRPQDAWPLLLAANRDERLDREWDPPAAHWPEYSGVIAGRDRAGGGTWMGLNRHGVAAAVLNRSGSLGPAPGKRSRGMLPLLALRHPTAAAAAGAMAALDASEYRTFNMVLADRGAAIFVRGRGTGRPESRPLSPGAIHMVTAHDPDNVASARVARHLPRLRAAALPRPESGDWSGWAAILADRSGPAGSEINVPPAGGFGTVCATLLALPAAGAPIFLFAPGPPDTAPFAPMPPP